MLQRPSNTRMFIISNRHKSNFVLETLGKDDQYIILMTSIVWGYFEICLWNELEILCYKDYLGCLPLCASATLLTAAIISWETFYFGAVISVMDSLAWEQRMQWFDGVFERGYTESRIPHSWHTQIWSSIVCSLARQCHSRYWWTWIF